jgi:DNA ligase-associated metallophosphoesterase
MTTAHREIALDIAGARLTARADRALVWRDMRTVFIADLHLGKAAAFRASGIAVPERGTSADLDRLATIVREERATRLVILGDFFHARAGRTPAIADAAHAWRSAIDDVEIVLIRGNHDRSAGDPPASLRFELADNGMTLGPFSLRHEPSSGGPGYTLAGHLHPAVRLEDPVTGQGLKAACYWFGASCGVVPAFGGFTGTAIIRPARGDRVIALLGGAAIDCSARLVP